MAEEKFGIDGIKEILIAGFALAQTTTLALEDGFQAFQDILAVAPQAMNVSTVIKKDLAQAKEEYNDLSDDERNQIIEFVKEKFDIANDEVEAKVEQVFKLLMVADETRVVFSKKAA